MTFTRILTAITFAMLVAAVYFIVRFIGQKKWKHAAGTAILFIVAIGAMYFGVITLITSM